jgi:transcriptional regulator with XRE-family HTH domain
MKSISDILKEARKKLGWNQAELARRLNIGQQTVSGWERGTSRPRRPDISKLARVLEIDADQLLKAAGHTGPIASPRIVTLRLADLMPEKFEQFTADLVQLLYPKASVHRFGEQGHKQDGVDVIAVKPDGKMEATFQCKRRQQFGPEEVKKAVADVPADFSPLNYIMLTRTASPDARKTIMDYPAWRLWDDEDISRVIRQQIPKDRAVRLIDTYFPGMREPFLGVKEPGPWQVPEEFYGQFRGNIYSHDWHMVGRDDILKSALDFVKDKDQWMAAVVGRGGIGKTRFLRAIADAIEKPGHEVRLLGSKEVGPEHYELLPTDGELLVMIDDAHERSDIAEIVAGIKRVVPNAKVLLSLRPYGLTQLATDLRRIQVHTSEFPRWEIQDLIHDDAMQLVREILDGSYNDAVIKRLAQISTDCPLIAVVGAELLKRGELNIASLEKDDGIRTEILGRMRDALVADPLGGNAEIRQKALEAISIMQPVHIKDETFQTALATMTGLDFDQLLSHINSLEDAGVLLRRGQSIRIVPDLLGDAILTDACFDSRSGMTKGYIERARQQLDGKPLQHVFINASRVDWQIRQEGGKATSLVESLWDAVEKEFKEGDLRVRRSLLELIKKVAYFQPDRALSLVRWAVANPTVELEETEDMLGKIYPPSPADVLHAIPPILKSIAYNFEYLPPALDLLWQLARSDKRATNQYPDHPLRVLTDLAEYDIGKPPVFNQAVLDVCKEWLAVPNPDDVASPFDVLERLLATEGTDNYSDGLKISFRPFAIRLDAVKDLRKQVIDIALEKAKSSNLKEAVRAIKTIGEGLDYPHGSFGREVSDKEHDAWTGVFVETINLLQPLAADVKLDPVVGLAIRKALQWHQRYSKSATKQAAQAVIAKIPDDLEHHLTVLLYDGWGRLLFEHMRDYEAAQKRQTEHFDEFAQKLVDHYSTNDLILLIEDRLKVLDEAMPDDRGNSGPIIWHIVKQKPEVGLAICRRIVESPGSSLASLVPIVLGRLTEDRPGEVIALARELLDTNDKNVCIGTAQAFGWNRAARSELLLGELELLSDLAVHKDWRVRIAVINAVHTIAKSDPLEAASLLLRVKIDDSQELIQEFCGVLGSYGQIQWVELAPDQQDMALKQLEACESLSDHHITDFLAVVAKTNPDRVVELMMKRVERDEQKPEDVAGDWKYQPVPYHWEGDLSMRSHPKFGAILREIRDWIAAKPDSSWQRIRLGSEIFKHVTGGQFDDTAIAVLDEAINSGDSAQFSALTAIVHDIPKQVVWENVPLIIRILHTGEQLGGDHLKFVSSALHSAVISGTRSGTPGQPFPEDVEQKENALRIASSLPPGSIEQEFYKSLERSADASMLWHAEADEQHMDNRDW